MRTPRNILRHELIGLEARVLKAKNPSNVGLAGKIVDETQNTLTLEVSGRQKKIFKSDIVLALKLPDGKQVQIDGALLVGRPWERIKKKFPRF
ncbi:MAG: ribonuclease P protein component 1 [Candidatus Nanoarchaeia archaeon]